MTLPAWKDPWGRSFEDVVQDACCGIVNSAPEGYVYDPDQTPALAAREAHRRLSRYPAPRAATSEELLLEEQRFLEMFREFERSADPAVRQNWRIQATLSENRIQQLSGRQSQHAAVVRVPPGSRAASIEVRP